MATNPIPDGTTNLSINLPIPLRKKIQSLADASGITVSAYVRALLRAAVEEQITSTLIAEKPHRLGYAPARTDATQAPPHKSDKK